MLTFKSIKPLFFLLLIFIFACEQPKTEVPKNIIPEDSIVKIIADVEIIEAGLSLSQVSQDTVVPATKKYYGTILKKYRITQKRFEESLSYFSTNPERFEGIFEKVINELSRRQSLEANK